MGRATATIGPWMKSGTEEGDPPHRAPWQTSSDRYAYLSAVYGDEAKTVVVAVQDFDGCQALVEGVGPYKGDNSGAK